jgi:hypothetical protein
VHCYFYAAQLKKRMNAGITAGADNACMSEE